MEPNYTYYPIDTSDVWSYIREKVILGEYPPKAAELLIDKIQPLIITDCDPSFEVEMYDLGSESEKNYYSLQVEKYKKAINNIPDKFRLDYFFHQLNCYQYDRKIIIKKDNPDFDYWFALKLSQYDEKIYEIPNFLQYHLNKSYKERPDKFNDFLKHIIRQYAPKYLSDNISVTVNEWFHKQFSKEKAIRKSNRYEGSFVLTNENIIISEPKKIKDLLDDLKKGRFINETANIEKGKSIFSGKPIKKNDRLIWIGTNYELKVFIQGLSNFQKISIPIKGIWDITCNCFVNKNNKEYKTDQLRNATGKKNERTNYLNSLIEKI